MKALIAIPHYAQAGSGAYGSTAAGAAGRGAVLAEVLTTLHRSFGPRQSQLMNRRHNIRRRANRSASARLDLVVCTTGDSHALNGLNAGTGLFEHRPTGAEPLMLGFECHRVLAERIGDYDWYGYMEDDLILQDPLFFAKLAWFLSLAGPDALLLPHRYEIRAGSAEKLYIDGHMSADFATPWQTVTDRPGFSGDALGLPVSFERPNNPHAGCFFLDAAQMRHWAAQPHFGDRDTGFAGPLESAASLGIMKTFRIYKTAPDSAGFLEIRHAGNRYLGNWLDKPGVPRQPAWTG